MRSGDLRWRSVTTGVDDLLRARLHAAYKETDRHVDFPAPQSPACYSPAPCSRVFVVIGAPQNLNVYCTFAEPLSKLGSKWLSSRERTQPRFNTRKTSLPGRRIQRKRL